LIMGKQNHTLDAAYERLLVMYITSGLVWSRGNFPDIR
jgi:hypothetical protein